MGGEPFTPSTVFLHSGEAGGGGQEEGDNAERGVGGGTRVAMKTRRTRRTSRTRKENKRQRRGRRGTGQGGRWRQAQLGERGGRGRRIRGREEGDGEQDKEEDGGKHN